MGIPIEALFEILIRNVRRADFPVRMPFKSLCSWAQALKLPKGGNTILYTSGLYQLVPYIESLTSFLETLEDKKAPSLLIKMGSAISKLLDPGKMVAKASKEELNRSHETLRRIALMLRMEGIDFGYLYEDDIYSGALLHDLGMDEAFKEQALKVYDIFKRYEVKRVITVDPHTTHILRSIYPKVLKGFDVKAISYLEVLSGSGMKRKVKDEYVIHDPCIYARYEEVLEQPRRLLSAAGIELLEPFRTEKLTYCCGGPIEMLSPKMALNIARKRVDELKQIGRKIVTLCPICYVNLAKADDEVEVQDISWVLWGAYEE